MNHELFSIFKRFSEMKFTDWYAKDHNFFLEWSNLFY